MGDVLVLQMYRLYSEINGTNSKETYLDMAKKRATYLEELVNEKNVPEKEQDKCLEVLFNVLEESTIASWRNNNKVD